MARRNQGILADVLDITTELPWWVGIVLAVASYLVLHYFATQDLVVATDPKAIGANAIGALEKGASAVLQYIVPFVFLAGSARSVFVRWKRNALHLKAATADRALEEMSWREFETLVGEFFRRRGFAVEETGGGGADGGVDLIASHGTDRYMIQCKQWKAQKVGVTVVRELYGVMAAQGAAGGFVVTSGVFTDEAKRFAEGREIELVPCDRLLAMIREQRRNLVIKKATAAAAAAFPSCPECGSPMVMRTARKGVQAGNSFWGCSTYPKCRGTREMTEKNS